MPNQKLSIVVRYTVGIILVAAAYAARLSLQSILGDTVPYLLFIPAVLVGAFYGGLGPGLLATFLSTLIGNFFFIHPTHAFTIGKGPDQVLMVIFVGVGIFISWLGDALVQQKDQQSQLLESTIEIKSQLVEAQEQISSLLENMRDGFFSLDKEWRYTYVNRRIEGIAQKSKEDLVGNRIWDVFPDRIEKEDYQEFQRAMAEQTPVHFERFDTHDGTWYEIDLYPTKNGLYVFVRDITALKKTEETQAHLAAIVESSDDAIVSKTLQGIITSWNRGAERLFGYSASEIIGKPILTLIPPDRHKEEELILERLRGGGRIDHYETMRMRKDGTLIDVSLTISPIKDSSGRTIGASKIAHDITERKKAEAERERLFTLEREARAKAEETSRLKDEFLATVSHELRTPLNSIFGWSRMLRDGKLDDEAKQHAVDTIERNAKAQAQLIEDLLDVSRIITGKLRLEIRTLMLTPTVEAAIDSLQPTAAAKGVRLQLALDPDAGPVAGDSARLQQVVWNLLSNAIKFTPKGGRVQVRLERVNSQFEITVSDTGQGINHEFLPYVFERFRQEDASITRAAGGLGLGLAIVRHLVELHGGTVNVSSPGEGQGATFTVKLPLMVMHERPTEKREHPKVETEGSLPLNHTPSLAGARVLIVDDDPDTRSLLRTILEQCEAEVRDAGSAEQGFQEAKEWNPSIIISDIGMPEEDGYTFIRKFRKWEGEAGAKTPAIALTAYARSQDRVEAILAGFQTHIAKPVEPLEFTLIVASLIKQRGDRQRGDRHE